jgi:hypothetical protein
MKTKVCARCNDAWPPDTEFFRSSQTPWCIACEREAGRPGDGKRNRSAEYIKRRQERDKLRWATTAKGRRQQLTAQRKAFKAK